eukprot:RCo011891
MRPGLIKLWKWSSSPALKVPHTAPTSTGIATPLFSIPAVSKSRNTSGTSSMPPGYSSKARSRASTDGARTPPGAAAGAGAGIGARLSFSFFIRAPLSSMLSGLDRTKTCTGLPSKRALLSFCIAVALSSSPGTRTAAQPSGLWSLLYATRTSWASGATFCSQSFKVARLASPVGSTRSKTGTPEKRSCFRILSEGISGSADWVAGLRNSAKRECSGNARKKAIISLTSGGLLKHLWKRSQFTMSKRRPVAGNMSTVLCTSSTSCCNSGSPRGLDHRTSSRGTTSSTRAATRCTASSNSFRRSLSFEVPLRRSIRS